MRNGWYESTRQIIHFVKDSHYLCNGAVGIKPVRKWKKDQIIDILMCKHCGPKMIPGWNYVDGN